MQINNICFEHNLPYDGFCQKIDCPSSNRFGCAKCIGFGVHKMHDCIEIAVLQQAIKDYQKRNTSYQSNADEIETSNNCINFITQQIKQVRIRIDQLFVELEKALVSEVNSRNPASNMKGIYQIDPENIYSANDIDA